MRPELLYALVALGFAMVVVRRRTLGIALVGVQSLVLGAIAIGEALGRDEGSLTLAIVLVLARGVVLPLLLLRVVRDTREARRVSSERFVFPRLILAVAAVALAIALVPPFGLTVGGAEQATVALLVLGIVIAAVRAPVVFQAIGFLVAENGVYLAGLAVEGGVPGAIELALLFDLLAVLAVVAAFGAKIHEQFGSSDTSLLRDLRD